MFAPPVACKRQFHETLVECFACQGGLFMVRVEYHQSCRLQCFGLTPCLDGCRQVQAWNRVRAVLAKHSSMRWIYASCQGSVFSVSPTITSAHDILVPIASSGASRLEHKLCSFRRNRFRSSIFCSLVRPSNGMPAHHIILEVRHCWRGTGCISLDDVCQAASLHTKGSAYKGINHAADPGDLPIISTSGSML